MPNLNLGFMGQAWAKEAYEYFTAPAQADHDWYDKNCSTDGHAPGEKTYCWDKYHTSECDEYSSGGGADGCDFSGYAVVQNGAADKCQKCTAEEKKDQQCRQELKAFCQELETKLAGDSSDDTPKDTPEQSSKSADTEKESEPASKSTPKARTAEEKKLAQDRIAELKDNAQKMKEKENSFENKLLGATGMLTVGQGGQDWAAGSAEKKADDAAERSMRAYLETFRCTYGGGTQVKGGEKNVILPGGNALMGIYTEYITRAQELKATKESLGMRPGIESEMVIDKANSGLYDDVAIGKTGGAFASVYRALTDPTSDDAKRWNEQKAESEKRAKSGKTMAIAGAAATGVASVLLNKNAPKESSEKINNKYDKMLQDLQAKLDALPKPQVTCPNNAKPNADGTCVCNAATQGWNSNTKQCEDCGDDSAKQGNICVAKAPAGSDKTPSETPSEATTGGALAGLSVPGDTSFRPGKSIVTDAAASLIEEYATEVFKLTRNKDATTDYCITVTGHTDKTGREERKKQLSLERAKAVANILTNNYIPEANVSVVGKGSQDCQADGDQAACRRVSIRIRENACPVPQE